MVTTSIQDRTEEFRAVLAQAQKQKSLTKLGSQRQSLLTDTQRRAANGSPNGETKGPKRGARSEFARRAAEIGRGISGTMEKLERLAQRTCHIRINISPSSSYQAYKRWTSSVPDSGLTSDLLGSCQEENTLRRSTCRDQRIDLCYKARFVLAERSDIFVAVVITIKSAPKFT